MASFDKNERQRSADHGRGIMQKQANKVGLPLVILAKVHGMSPGADGARARAVQKHDRISAMKGC